MLACTLQGFLGFFAFVVFLGALGIGRWLRRGFLLHFAHAQAVLDGARLVVEAFQPLATVEISAHLNKIHSISPERAAVIARLAGGSLSRAIDLLDEKKLDRRNLILETVSEIHKSGLTDLLAATSRWKGDNLDLQQDLEWLKTWIRDLLVEKFEATDSVGLLNSDLAHKIKIMASHMSSDHLLQFFDLVCTVQGAIGYNVNRRLSLETLLLLFYTRATRRGREIGADLPLLARGQLTWPVGIGG